MVKGWQFWLLTLLALAAAVVAVANMVLFQGNRTMQSEVAIRQQFVQQTAQLEVLYREIVKALADLSVRNQDADLRNLLAAQGISVPANPVPPAAAPAADASKKGVK